jgi:hypothetical protein
MQKSLFQKTALTVITVTLLFFCFCFLQKVGIQPLAAAFTLTFLWGLIRFIFRLTVMLLSTAIVILLIIILICI